MRTLKNIGDVGVQMCLGISGVFVDSKRLTRRPVNDTWMTFTRILIPEKVQCMTVLNESHNTGKSIQLRF